MKMLMKRGFVALRRSGPRQTTERVARYLGNRFGGEETFPLADALVADPSTAPPLVANPRPRGSVLRIGWVCTPPALGSGGHTTMFRMVRALEERGHKCSLFLYDRFDGDFAQHEEIIRQGWPEIAADVRDATDRVSDVDALVATSWESAHVVAHIVPAHVRRFYFIQDFEPWFYPHGAHHDLALLSYRFGFQHIALGAMVARCLEESVGAGSDTVHFGCDRETYRLLEPASARQGIVSYMRPVNPRRGHWIARLALTEFARRRPDVPIYLFGSRLDDLPFQATVYPHLSPTDLNALYNRCVVGLALSFTNISLVPEELLRAGVVPVVNERGSSREVLVNPHVRWAEPTPGGLATALCEAADNAATPDPATLSASVDSDWSRTAREVVTVIEDAHFDTSTSGAPS